ncbi:MAG: hypothetical protein LC541_14850 [Candidatus Thiodiazotropha sp.]|nr:hypothetical protein [Candidatus Thiodiazotropha sp.]MCM8884548.1 hypothetical protein [Candidatus Thiodiazotropha sp.]
MTDVLKRDALHISIDPGGLPEDMSDDTKRYIINLTEEISDVLESMQGHMSAEIAAKITTIEILLRETKFDVNGGEWDKDA